MQRIAIAPRSDWQRKVEAIGFDFHTLDAVYWDESACYRFSAAEIDRLEAASAELHRLCLYAVEQILKHDWFARLQVPAAAIQTIRDSWTRGAPTVYGRFDLAYDGSGPPKLLEYNADTPTALFEASVVQWQWFEDRFPDADQFNSLHEKLIAHWHAIAGRLPVANKVYFACARDSREDLTTTTYMRDVCAQAGFETAHLFIDEIGWDAQLQRFVDVHGGVIPVLFKLYPWEWLWAEAFAQYLPREPMRILEPAWKLLLSNKGLLAILWELFPDHPNLLPAFTSPQRLTGAYVKKPFYSREGANVSIVAPDMQAHVNGPYGAEGFVYQAYTPLPAFDGNYPVIGAWIVGDAAAGIGIREDRNRITQNSSRFVPHYFTDL